MVTVIVYDFVSDTKLANRKSHINAKYSMVKLNDTIVTVEYGNVVKIFMRLTYNIYYIDRIIMVDFATRTVSADTVKVHLGNNLEVNLTPSMFMSIYTAYAIYEHAIDYGEHR